MGPGQPPDEPGSADGKALSARLGLRAVRLRIPAHAGHAWPGTGPVNSLLRQSCADESGAKYGRVGTGRSALASKTFIAAARMSCGFQLIGASNVSMCQQRAYPRAFPAVSLVLHGHFPD